MISTKLALTVASRQTQPPWHLRDLLTTLQLKRISLRSLVAGIGRQTVTFWVKVVDPSTVDDFFKVAETVEELRDFIKSAPLPSKAILARLSDMLTSTGASLILSKKTFDVVGVSGTVESLAKIPAMRPLDVKTGIALIGSGTAGAAGIILGVALASNPVGWVVIGVALVGVAGAGAVVGVGIVEVLDGDPKPQPKERPSASEGETPTEDQLDFPDDTFGSPPSDVADAIAAGGSVADFAVVDTSQIPDFPPDVSAGEGGGLPGSDGTDTGQGGRG